MYITLLTSTSIKMQAHKTSTRKRRHSLTTHFSPDRKGEGERRKEKK